jgi:hypothetical protein
MTNGVSIPCFASTNYWSNSASIRGTRIRASGRKSNAGKAAGQCRGAHRDCRNLRRKIADRNAAAALGDEPTLKST